MPYATNADLPDAVRSKYSDRCQTVFRKAFDDHDGDEASKFAVAHTAAQNCERATKDATGTFELKEFAPQDVDLKEDGSVTVAFAKLDAVDTDGDYTFPGAFPQGKSVAISAYSHASWAHKGGQLPAGRGVIEEKDGWAVLDGKFFLKTTNGRDTYEVVKEMGELQQWSYGYRVTDTAPVPTGVKARRGLKGLDVREISPVFLGAQPLAHTMAIKEYTPADDLLDDLDMLGELKDGLPAGLSYAEASSRMLRALTQFTERTAAINDLRLKEGRKLSGQREKLLREHLAALDAAREALDAMLVEASPPPTEGKGLSAAAARLALARFEFASLRTAGAD